MSETATTILKYIQAKDRVLDLGCGDGSLLEQLIIQRSIVGYGLDLDEDNISQCIQKGLSVFQGNIDEGLNEFKDKIYDVVILSQTLQQIKNPLFVMEEMCRVSKIGIVTFPNFAHWRCRWQLLRGEIPKSEALPYDWYNTPNIRVVSLKSFRRVCKEHQFTIVAETPLYEKETCRWMSGKWNANLCAPKGLFVIKKDS